MKGRIHMILKWIMRLFARLWKRRAVYYIGGSEVLPPPLSPEEEQATVEACQAGDEQARNKLIEHNLRLVVFLARKFESAAVSTEDSATTAPKMAARRAS